MIIIVKKVFKKEEKRSMDIPKNLIQNQNLDPQFYQRIPMRPR